LLRGVLRKGGEGHAHRHSAELSRLRKRTNSTQYGKFTLLRFIKALRTAKTAIWRTTVYSGVPEHLFGLEQVEIGPP